MFSRRHFLQGHGWVGRAQRLNHRLRVQLPRCCGFASRATTFRRRNGPQVFKLRIAAIADLHACDPWMSLDHIQAIVERTNALKPDIIVMLGDYVAGHRKVTRFIPDAEWAAVLAGLKAPLGVHAVLGNHDWWEDKDSAARRAGIAVRRPRAGGRRHSGLRKRREETQQERPSVLAGRSRRSTGLYAGAPLPAAQAHRRRRSRRDAGESHRRRAGRSDGARARRREARALARRAAALRPYPWRPGAHAGLVADLAVRTATRLWPHPR